MTRRVFTPKQDKEVVTLYLAGYATRKIAELFNCEKSAVSNALQREGVSRRTNRDLTNGEEAQIAKVYQAGYSIPRIARAYGKSDSLIHGAVVRQGSELRDDRFDFCEAEEVEIIKIYLAGYNMRDIAKAYGCKSGTIRRILDRRGIRTRENVHQETIKYRDKEISRLYNDGKTIDELTRIQGLSLAIIHKSLVRNNTPRRPLRKDFFNEQAFDDLNDEHTLYWLGFAYADGNVSRRSFRLVLSVRDIKHVERFIKFLNSSTKIRFYRNNCGADFYSPYMTDRLTSLGIVPRREMFNRLENLIPDGMEHHFIRGLIDGDGCISNREKVMILGQFDILQWVKRIIVNNAQVSDRVSIRQETGIHEVTWGGRLQFIRVVDYIYKDATVYLERKKEIADKTKRG